MTYKEHIFAAALAGGTQLEEAAGLAGYNLKYAKRKATEPAFEAIVERFQRPQADTGEERSEEEILREILFDPMTSDRDKLQAIRVSALLRRYTPPEPPEPPTIIDDVWKCPLYETCDHRRRAAEAENNRERLKEDEQTPGE